MNIFITGVSHIHREETIIEQLEKVLNSLTAEDLNFNIAKVKGVSEVVYKYLIKNNFKVTLFNNITELTNCLNSMESNNEDILKISFRENLDMPQIKNNTYQFPILSKSEVYRNYCDKIHSPDFSYDYCGKCGKDVFKRYTYEELATGKVFITCCPNCGLSFCD